MKGLRITVAVGTDDGTFTNVFVKMLSFNTYMDGAAIDFQIRCYRSEAAFDADKSDTVMIRFLPLTMSSPAFTITDLNNRANMETFLYGRLKTRIETRTGAATVQDVL